MSDAFNILQAPTVEKTTAEVIADELRLMVNNAAKQLVELHQQPFNKLWRRTQELGVDPQDVLDSLGADGETVFKLGGELATFILGGYGNTKVYDLQENDYLPPFPYEVNNGKVTLKRA